MAFLIERLGPPRAASRAPAAGEAVPSGRSAAGALRHLGQGRQASLVLRAGAMALAGGALLWGTLVAAETLLATRQAEATAVAAPAAQAWTEVIRPMPIFDLGGTDFAKLPRHYQARRQGADGAREDTLSFGAPGDGRPYLRLALERRGEGGAGQEAPALADALARLAGSAGDTVSRIAPLPPAETRFGTLERADLAVWRDGTALACSGFRAMPNGGSVLTVAGLACRGADRPLADNVAACIVDRIGLVAAGDDRPLRTLFVAAERRPGAAACREGVLASTAGPPSAPGPFEALRRRAAWLEGGAGGPPLRGVLDASDGEH